MKGNSVQVMAGEHKDMVTSLVKVGPNVWSGSRDETIHIFNAKTRKCLNIIENVGPINCLQLMLPKVGEQLIVWAGGIGVVSRFDPETFAILSTENAHKTHAIHSLLVVDDKMWSASSDKRIGVFNREGRLLQTMEGHQSYVYALLKVGDYVWSSSWDKNIFIWDPKKRESLAILACYHTDAIICMTLIKKLNGELEIFTGSASKDGHISIINPANIKL